ncbi:hypothetical protein BHM03_00000333 [Ensete ventricosum]|nr:hypothetical protein BHM03_00000333 [Ensete ventricosum]
MTSSDSSSSVRVISSPGSGGVSQDDPEVNSSGVSSGPQSSVDARVLRDLEVMKADHDLDTAVTEGSLAVIRGRYSISSEYGLHVLRPGQRPYSSDALGMCITVDALEAGLRFPLHLLIEECLRWRRISPSQVAPNSWRYLVVFLGERRGAGIIPTRDLFMAYFHLCKSRGGYYLTARVSFRVSEAPSNNKGWKSRYLFVSGPVWGFRLDWSAHPIDNASPYLSEEEFILVGRLKEILSSSYAIKEMTELWLVKAAPKASSKRLIDAPTEQANDPARRHKKVKVLTRRHKSRHGEGESRSHSKGKEPAVPSEEPDTPVESDEGDASPVYHRPRSMKDLFKTKVHKGDTGYYTLQMGLLHPQLARELYMLPSEVLLARVAKEMVLMALFDRVYDAGSELEQELEKTKRERDEALQRLEASEKKLNEVRSNLAEIQRLLKEALVRAQKMDDELLQAVKALENARAELPKQAVTITRSRPTSRRG